MLFLAIYGFPFGHNFSTLDLEWKVLYVGSAHDSHQDQVLDEILVGPVPVGMNKFVLQADAPAVSKLPENDILGVTVVLVTCSYKEREFVRVGYYVNNEYTGEYDLEVGPPPAQDLEMALVQRQILADKPRVTKFPIPWGKEDENADVQQHQMAEEYQIMQEKLMEVAGTPSTATTEMDME
jgi:histone chaperone ASF1